MTSRFRTIVLVKGSLILIVGEPGAIIEYDEETTAALLRDVPGCLRTPRKPREKPVVETAPPPEPVPKAKSRQVRKAPKRR